MLTILLIFEAKSQYASYAGLKLFKLSSCLSFLSATTLSTISLKKKKKHCGVALINQHSGDKGSGSQVYIMSPRAVRAM